MTETEIIILKAAQTVFLRKGFDAASMGDIAREARISRPALHYYFRTKHALFRAILADAAGRLFPKISDIVKSDGPLTAKAERIVTRYHELLLENPLLPQFILSEAQREPRALLELVRGQRGAGELFAFLRTELAPRLSISAPRGRELPLFFSIVYALLFFPFLAKPVLDLTLFGGDPEAFRRFVTEERQPLMMTLVMSLLGPRRKNKTAGRAKRRKSP